MWHCRNLHDQRAPYSLIKTLSQFNSLSFFSNIITHKYDLFYSMFAHNGFLKHFCLLYRFKQQGLFIKGSMEICILLIILLIHLLSHVRVLAKVPKHIEDSAVIEQLNISNDTEEQTILITCMCMASVASRYTKFWYIIMPRDTKIKMNSFMFARCKVNKQ